LDGFSAVEGAALLLGESGIGGVRGLVEQHVLVVGLVGGEQAGALPGLDGGGVQAEAFGDLVGGEQSAGADAVGVAGEAVVAAQVQHDLGGERLAGA
jgi:hypothetical protein